MTGIRESHMILPVKSRRIKTLRLGPESAGVHMSPAQFDAVTEYDDNHSYELIHGVLIVSPIPSEGEAAPNHKLGSMLDHYQELHPQGGSLDLTLDERYVYLPRTRRKADRVIWAGLGRLPDPKRDVPAIVVEFVSQSRRDWERDYVEKRREYLGLGVKEYWVIDRFRRLMNVFTVKPRGRGAVNEVMIGETDVYRTPLLPGFELPLARLLKAADPWTNKG